MGNLDEMVRIGAAMGRKFLPAFKPIYQRGEFMGFRVFDLDLIMMTAVDSIFHAPEKPLSEEILGYHRLLRKSHPDKARNLIQDFDKLLEYVNAMMPYNLENSPEREQMLKDLWDTRIFPKYALLLAHLRQ